MLRAVVSQGPQAPLPAEICTLNHPSATEREKFFHMASVDTEVYQGEDTDCPGYIGPPTEPDEEAKKELKYRMRSFLIHIIAECWTQFILEQREGTYCKSYAWKEPTDCTKVTFIDNINKIVKSYDNEVQDRVQQYGADYLAELVVNLAETLRVHKNWNSHAARVGTAVCNMAIMLADCALVTDVKDLQYHRLRRPAAKVLTGGCYGSRDNVYVEYMSSVQTTQPDGTPVNFLDPNTFRTQGHERIVSDIFNQKLPGRDGNPVYPTARPTKSCTADWTVKYRGCEVLHGEGKCSMGAEGVEKACLCACAQLAYNRTALVMHSSGNHFRLYKIRKDGSHLLVTFRKTRTYDLQQVYAGYSNRRHVAQPAPEGLMEEAESLWTAIYPQVQTFLVIALDMIDMLSWELGQIDYDSVKFNFEESYKLGLYREPSFWNMKDAETEEPQPSQRDITDQSLYQYSQDNMDLWAMALHKRRRSELVQILNNTLADVQARSASGRLTARETTELTKVFLKMIDNKK